mmetsp:Transcript_18614/g.56195  ORF Transcript_18614/g.56195 Transcript_18614/m.56195 type:complete len:271 (-) Transcript_18614:318-1130(-)
MDWSVSSVMPSQMACGILPWSATSLCCRMARLAHALRVCHSALHGTLSTQPARNQMALKGPRWTTIPLMIARSPAAVLLASSSNFEGRGGTIWPLWNSLNFSSDRSASSRSALMSTVTPCLVVFARATAASARCASSETSIESSSSGSLWRSAMTLSKRLSPSGARAELSLSISRRAFSARAIASSLRSFAPLLSSIRTMGSCPAPAAIMSAFSFALAGPSKSALAFTSSRAVDSWPYLHAAIRGVSPCKFGLLTRSAPIFLLVRRVRKL